MESIRPVNLQPGLLSESRPFLTTKKLLGAAVWQPVAGDLLLIFMLGYLTVSIRGHENIKDT